MERYAIIVDAYHIPYEDSRGFASAFKKRGITPIAVMSSPEPMEAFLPRWFPEDFAAVHFYGGDFEELVAIVKGYDPICIVPGLEPGVELAGELVDAVLPGTGNLPGSSPIHRDKALMAQALERNGVPHLRTICSDDSAAVAEWLRDNDLEGRPLVIKPPKSSGAEDVCLIEAGHDWKAYFDQLLGTVNHYGMVNDGVIVQEYAEGTEYIVDLYSVDGQHGLVDVCVYQKREKDGQIGIYDVADFLAPDDPAVAPLAEYTKQAATACGIRNGSTHAEVMLTPDGPRLIELAARYSGSCMMISGTLATGENQIDRTVAHYVDGKFSPGFELLREVRTVWLAADKDGILRNIEIFDQVRELPTFYAMSLPENGKHVPLTTGMSTSLGWIIQGASDWDAIEADFRVIKDLERQLVVEPVAVR
ncbi:MAG TPA: ATP-grasp domain-containing protein [Streptosporangiaceae bacterium]|nr:ATP-grasp domain-containing protein [Streptosporangiaceae bacterium]